jgi:6-pyruvoyltetrahydropterin/6-carboxytetrahydropterin synthase
MREKNKIQCVRRIQFCSGHRVHNHESKCATIHGHNYVAFFHAEAPELDSIGRVIDFSVLKEKIGGWIDFHWDHAFLVSNEDTKSILLLGQVPGKKPLVVCSFNPTAENMADYLLRTICPLVLDGTDVTITKVVLWETENCFCSAEL